MALVQRLVDLVARIGGVLSTKIDASHPSAARAWVCFGYLGGQIVIRSAYNVAGITRTAQGRYRIAFATALADAGYAWVALAFDSAARGQQASVIVRAPGDAKSAEHLDVSCAASATTYGDCAEINVVVLR